jgi:hypothetical protein
MQKQSNFHHWRIAEFPAGWSTEVLRAALSEQHSDTLGISLPTPSEFVTSIADVVLARAQLTLCMSNTETTDVFLSAFNTLAEARARVNSTYRDLEKSDLVAW